MSRQNEVKTRVLYHIGKTPAFPKPAQTKAARNTRHDQEEPFSGAWIRPGREPIASGVFLTPDPHRVALNHGVLGHVYSYKVPEHVVRKSGGIRTFDGASEIVVPHDLWHHVKFLGKSMDKQRFSREVNNVPERVLDRNFDRMINYRKKQWKESQVLRAKDEALDLTRKSMLAEKIYLDENWKAKLAGLALGASCALGTPGCSSAPKPEIGGGQIQRKADPITRETSRTLQRMQGQTAPARGAIRDLTRDAPAINSSLRKLKPIDYSRMSSDGQPARQDHDKDFYHRLLAPRGESRTINVLNALLEQQPVPTDPKVLRQMKTSIGYPPPGMIRMKAYPAGEGKGLKGPGIDAEYPDTPEGNKLAQSQAWMFPSKITKAGKKRYRI